MWFAINSSHIYAVPVTVLLLGLPKRKTAKLRHLILVSRGDILSTLSGDALRGWEGPVFATLGTKPIIGGEILAKEKKLGSKLVLVFDPNWW